ncbi:MAG: cob(I)yrinic acid a,c-diamide adenosyltransferase [Pseudomonadota bacterium]
MVVLNKIYTRTGDDGTTALGSGARVAKDGPRVAAYGTVDETNAAVGVARLALGKDAANVAAQLLRIQNDLFDLGADLCMPDHGEALPYTPLRVTDDQVRRLETEIDALNQQLQPLRSFVLPGGTPAGAALHLARTICRRAERATVELSRLDDEPVSDAVLKYLNRLSDYLFVASRYVNDKGAADQLWVPGENR